MVFTWFIWLIVHNSIMVLSCFQLGVYTVCLYVRPGHLCRGSSTPSCSRMRFGQRSLRPLLHGSPKSTRSERIWDVEMVSKTWIYVGLLFFFLDRHLMLILIIVILSSKSEWLAKHVRNDSETWLPGPPASDASCAAGRKDGTQVESNPRCSTDGISKISSDTCILKPSFVRINAIFVNLWNMFPYTICIEDYRGRSR